MSKDAWFNEIGLSSIGSMWAEKKPQTIENLLFWQAIRNYQQAELGEPHSRFKLSWILVPLYFFVPKILGWKNFWVQIIFLVQKLFESQKCKGQKTFCDKKLSFQKRFEFKNIWLQNISGPKYLGLLESNIILAKKH